MPVDRRDLLLGTGAALAALACHKPGGSPMHGTGYDRTVTPPSPGVYDLDDLERRDVRFPSDGYAVAAHLYMPMSAPPGGRYPAIIIDGPSPLIKEITVPVYGIKLARAGFMVLTFDG